jgi:beta-mannosidase
MGADPTPGWALTSLPAGAASDPASLATCDVTWIPAAVPGTAASALRAAGRWSFDAPRDFDAEDWWYRWRFGPQPDSILRLDGLATVADVWLNGRPLLHSENMFHMHRLPVGALPDDANELLIRFHALGSLLARRRPRPRWRTRLVASQQLRWLRTTLLGRMPGWSPPVAPVGPWRAVAMEPVNALSPAEQSIRTSVRGTSGIVSVTLDGDFPGVAAARLRVGTTVAPLAVERQGRHATLRGTLELPDVATWAPHTHGTPHRYAATVELSGNGSPMQLDLGHLGFRTLALDTTDGGFGLSVNGDAIFCRGACWSPVDPVSLNGAPDELRHTLMLMRDAGMNMVRVPGTMVYESDLFYDLCDELGILVWQDFMLANMDYPADDQDFRDSVTLEARQLLCRVAHRPALAMLCGGSEVGQQAAMLGLPREQRHGPLPDAVLPSLCDELAPGIPWCPSTPWGGTFPFSVDSGVTHYFGVGAYRRPLDDARRAGVRFAAECLAFSNIPEPRVVDELLGPGQSPAHHPRWKERVPRDAGAGWDFEDVRDHYVESLFRVKPLDVRYNDMDRYLALGRAATGEVMQAVMSEWRRPASTCRGALVLQWRDLWSGAGWGLLDAGGDPKSVYFHLKRVLQPVTLVATDEGLNGLALHLINEATVAFEGTLRVALYRHGEDSVGQAELAVALPPRSARTVSADAMFEGFRDLTHSYRFGPPAHDLIVATLMRAGVTEPHARAFHFPLGLPNTVERDVGLRAEALRDDDGWWLRVSTTGFAQTVALALPGFMPDDNYFHLEPGSERLIRLVGEVNRPPAGDARALNSAVAARVKVVDPE